MIMVPRSVPRTLASRLPKAAHGSQVRVEGWVHRRRVLASVTFLVVRDRSGQVQVVVRDPHALRVVQECGEETVVAVVGVVTHNPVAPGGVEITDPQITLLGEPAQTPPVEVWRPWPDAGLPTILDHGAVSWRHPARRARRELAAASLHGFLAEYVSLDAEMGFIADHHDVLSVLRHALAGMAYPMSKRPFYTHPQPGDERWSNSFDVLFRGLELGTGGQRLHRYSDYVAAIRARGEDPAAYSDYLETFAHGMPPHGGFAIGLERWTARLTNAENVREVTLFPRDLHRLTP
jgi:aspartyl/asparaginyl-tRNA synthetase